MPGLLKVGLDVSPLALTRVGTARYVRGLLSGLSGMGGVGVEPLSFPASGRAATLGRDLGCWDERARRFTWRETALRTLALYREVIAS